MKLNYDFSDLKYKHGPVVPLRSLKGVDVAGLIAGVTWKPHRLRHRTIVLLCGG